MTQKDASTAPSLESAIRDYTITEAAYQQAKQQYQAARSTLLGFVPKQIGEHVRSEAGWLLTVTYPEKDEWNSESIKAYYGEDLPVHIKAKLTVDKRALRGLPDEERDALLKCLDTKPGTPSIDIAKGVTP